MNGGFAARARASAEVVRRNLPPVSDPVVVRDVDILRFAEAVGASVRRDPDGRLVASPLFLPPLPPRHPIGPDGRRRDPTDLQAGGALPNRLMAGCEVVVAAPIRSGEAIVVSWRLDDVVEKQGRNGPMLLITTTTAYRTAEGEPRREERWTLVHRD